MKLTLYQVDAFADSVFSGNPAAVCPLSDRWPDDALMQDIAAENNLSETAFYINKGGNFHLRWFTPAAEVDLCGHATLATAFVQFMHEGYPGEMIEYASRSGLLSVRRSGDL
jgi:PhzF family phenazine biosynthesis protein